ncbi:MAG: hypothetical protein ABI196_21600 [Bradyrhizobium sp.]
MSDDPGEPEDLDTTDVSDPASVGRAKRRVRDKQKLGNAFWRGVFADPVGRSEMWELLQKCHTFEERFACGPNGFPQPEATWFEAGQQSFGLRLYQSWCLIDLPGVMLMHQECDGRWPKKVK